VAESKRVNNFLLKVLSFLLRRKERGKPFTVPGDITDSAQLLFIDSGQITDILFAAPVVNFFHQHYPQIRTTLLVNRDHAEIAKSIMNVKRIITYQENKLRLYKGAFISLAKLLRKQFIETVIILDREVSLERLLLGFFTGARVRIGFTQPSIYPMINCEIQAPEDGYEGEKMTKILTSTGLGDNNQTFSASVRPENFTQAKQYIHFRMPAKDSILVGVDPGRGMTGNRVISEILAYLANNLSSRKKVKVIVILYPWDNELVDSFSRLLKCEVIEAEPQKAEEIVSFLAQCDLFISGNTNLFHFSASLGIPTIGLFTKYDGEKWVPNVSNVAIFKGTTGEKLSLKKFMTTVEKVLAARNENSE
jgi:ADP-heptose:LPS heptosyltransferase